MYNTIFQFLKVNFIQEKKKDNMKQDTNHHIEPK